MIRVYDFWSYWRDVANFTTLPEYLRLAGYTSLSLGKVNYATQLQYLFHLFLVPQKLDHNIEFSYRYWGWGFSLVNTKVLPSKLKGHCHKSFFTPIFSWNERYWTLWTSQKYFQILFLFSSAVRWYCTVKFQTPRYHRIISDTGIAESTSEVFNDTTESDPAVFMITGSFLKHLIVF